MNIFVFAELLSASASSKESSSRREGQEEEEEEEEEGEEEGGGEWLTRCDVWSLGITLLELAVGKTPHAHMVNRAKVVQAILQSDAPTLPHDTPFSENMRDFVNKCLQKSPHLRSPVKELSQHQWVCSNIQHMKEEQPNTILQDLFFSIADLKEQKEAAEEAFRHKQAQELFSRHEREQEEEARDDMAAAEEETAQFLALQRAAALQAKRRAEKQRLEREAEETSIREAAEKKANKELRRREAAERQVMLCEDQEASLVRDEMAGALTVLRYSGEVLKRSDILGVWNSRCVVIDRTLVTYFATGGTDTNERGRFRITAHTQVEVSPTDESVVVIQDATPPVWTLRMKCIADPGTGGDSASAWMTRVEACIHYAQHVQPLLLCKRIAHLEEKIRFCGWVQKESVYLGQMNKRFLVLEKGVLRYFDQEESYGLNSSSCRGEFAFTAATTATATGSESGSSAQLRVADLTAPAPWSITVECSVDDGTGGDEWDSALSVWLRYMRAHIALVS